MSGREWNGSTWVRFRDLSTPVIIASPITSDCSGSVSLTATTNDATTTIKWHAAVDATTLLFTSNPTYTPTINATTTFSVGARVGTAFPYTSTRMSVVATQAVCISPNRNVYTSTAFGVMIDQYSGVQKLNVEAAFTDGIDDDKMRGTGVGGREDGSKSL